MGFSAFGWTWKRTATFAVGCVLPVAVISALWFPPPAFSGRILLRLLPVIAGAAVVALVAVLVMRRALRAGRRCQRVGRPDPLRVLPARRHAAARVRGAEGVRAGRADEPVPRAGQVRGARLRDGRVPRGGRDRARPRRDARSRRGVACGCGGSARRVLLGRAERLALPHPPAAVSGAGRGGHGDAAGAHGIGGSAKGRSRGRLPTWAHGVSIAVVVALVSAMALQGWRGTSRAEASFLATDYPSEVAAGIQPVLGSDGVLVTALPWAMHFRTDRPAWAAQGASIERLTSYVPADSTVLFLADASMRVHYPELERAVGRQFASRSLVSFMVPEEYLYGYSSTVDTRPVQVYRLTASELRSLVTSDSTPGPIQPRRRPSDSRRSRRLGRFRISGLVMRASEAHDLQVRRPSTPRPIRLSRGNNALLERTPARVRLHDRCGRRECGGIRRKLGAVGQRGLRYRQHTEHAGQARRHQGTRPPPTRCSWLSRQTP